MNLLSLLIFEVFLALSVGAAQGSVSCNDVLNGSNFYKTSVSRSELDFTKTPEALLPFGARIFFTDGREARVIRTSRFEIQLFDLTSLKTEVHSFGWNQTGEMVREIEKKSPLSKVILSEVDMRGFVSSEPVEDARKFYESNAGKLVVLSVKPLRSDGSLNSEGFHLAGIVVPQDANGIRQNWLRLRLDEGHEVTLDLKINFVIVENESINPVDAKLYLGLQFPILNKQLRLISRDFSMTSFSATAASQIERRLRVQIEKSFRNFVNSMGKIFFENAQCAMTAQKLRDHLIAFAPNRFHMEVFWMVNSKTGEVINGLQAMSAFALLRTWDYHAVLIYTDPSSKERWVLDPVFYLNRIVRLDEYVAKTFKTTMTRKNFNKVRSIELTSAAESALWNPDLEDMTAVREHLLQVLKLSEVEYKTN